MEQAEDDIVKLGEVMQKASNAGMTLLCNNHIQDDTFWHIGLAREITISSVISKGIDISRYEGRVIMPGESKVGSKIISYDNSYRCFAKDLQQCLNALSDYLDGLHE